MPSSDIRPLPASRLLPLPYGFVIFDCVKFEKHVAFFDFLAFIDMDFLYESANFGFYFYELDCLDVGYKGPRYFNRFRIEFPDRGCSCPPMIRLSLLRGSL